MHDVYSSKIVIMVRDIGLNYLILTKVPCFVDESITCVLVLTFMIK